MYGRSGRSGASHITLVVIIFVIFSVALYIFIFGMYDGPESARRRKCWSNLKQIGLDLKQYAFDNNDVLPWESTGPNEHYRLFGKLYSDYASNASIFRCPSSSETVMELSPDDADGSLFTEEECRKGLSYAYGHNQGKPWKESDPSSVRLVADKYATHDYASEPYPKHRPLNHSKGLNFLGITVRNVRKYGHRNFVRLDGSAKTTKELGPLEADPETEFEKSGDPEHDQTGRDWWSDPPDK